MSYIMIMFILMIIFIMMYILTFFNKHKKKIREKMSPFECGFDPMNNFRMAFSIHFFNILLMFLIFDIEITILMPIPSMLNLIKYTLWIYILDCITVILLLGLILEWKQGSMNWK